MASGDITGVDRFSPYSTRRFKCIHPKINPHGKTKPKGRSGHCMCSDESDIYVFGGYSPVDERNGVRENKVLPELWRFNFATQKWSKIIADNTPDTCASSSIAVFNKKVFVFGGTGYPFGHIMSNTVKTLNLKTARDHKNTLSAAGESGEQKSTIKQSWQLLETNPMSYNVIGEVEDSTPPPAYGQSLIFHHDAIYVFGGAVGYYSEAVSDLHKLNLQSMSWEKLCPSGTIPSGRYKQEVIQDSERFYVLGGGRLFHAESLHNIFAYDFAQNHWYKLQTHGDSLHGFPIARCSFGCAQEGSNVYISGGRHYSIDIEHRSLSDVWHLRLDTLQWTKLQMRLPDALYFHSAVISPSGHMYVFGGVHKDGFRAPYLYKVRLPHSMPKLSELCWEKVCGIAQALKLLKHKSLTEIGVPWNFIDRVYMKKK